MWAAPPVRGHGHGVGFLAQLATLHRQRGLGPDIKRIRPASAGSVAPIRPKWPAGMFQCDVSGRAGWRPQRCNSSALLTTLTLLKAMAAPAITGFSRPNAASGTPTTL